MTVRIITLGHPRAFLDEDELSSLPGKPVTFGLLVFLALEREATRDRLTGIFWPESDQEKARHALSQTLYELRQSLGQDWATSSGNTVRVAESLQVDALEFLELTEAGESARAVALYHGPFLEGVFLAQTHPFEEWVERQRARLGRRYRAAADGYIRGCRSRREMEDALAAAGKWVELDPLDDGAQQHLIQLLAETGSRNEALNQYERYAILLKTELGLDPLEETVALVEAIREGAFETEPLGEERGVEEGGEEGPIEDHPSDPGAPWPARISAEGGDGLGQVEDRARLQKTMEEELAPELEVLRPIGQGSMAEVFLAREPHLKRLVAVKVLSPGLYSDAQARRRFEREAQSAARLNHPHVCTVHRVGSLSDGTPFLVSPFVKGTTLGQRLKAEGRLSPSEVRRVLREVASALAAAHKLGIIHRDVRPDNVLRADDSGRHSLCDFGIAGVLETGEETEPKITKTGEILGHPAYVSPEQMDGLPLTDRADVYSLGVLGHQLLTGHPPHATKDPDRDSKGRTVEVELKPLAEYLQDTDPELAELIGHLLAKDPAHRPSAGDVERKLLGDRQHAAEKGGPGDAERRLGRLVFRKRLPHILGAYLAAGWLAVEAVDHFATREILPIELYWLTVVSTPIGFLAVSIVGWFHGERGRQEMPIVEKWLLWVLAVGWIAAVVWVMAGGAESFFKPS